MSDKKDFHMVVEPHFLRALDYLRIREDPPMTRSGYVRFIIEDAYEITLAFERQAIARREAEEKAAQTD